MNDTVIAVFGHTGMVGSAVIKYYTKRGYDVAGYSLDNHTLDFKKGLKNSDYIFVCVPTPFNWKTNQYDFFIVESVLRKLSKVELKTDAKIIIKSTVTPATTQRLQNKFKNLNLFFNPEFLSEGRAEVDYEYPDRQIVGYTNKTYNLATEVLHFLPNSPYDVIMTSTEAEIVKFVNNFHGALMVIFANLFFDIAESLGADYQVVKKASQASKWVGSPMGRMYWDIMHGGYRGYGGACFPKDVNGLTRWLKDMGINQEIVAATIKANKRILKAQNLTEPEVEKVSKRW